MDDEPWLLEMMSAYLKRLGYAVAVSDSTDAACRVVEEAPAEFAVAMLDGSMPGMSMQDLAMRILRANPRLGVIAASGYPVDMTTIEAAAPGRVTVLPKPFTPEMLAGVVRRMLATQEEEL